MTLRLRARNLACERDDRWLFEGLDVALHAGEILCVEGLNGSGKTTLLKILSGQLDDYEGTLHFDGRPLRACRDEFLTNLLFLGHVPGIKAGLSALENLAWYQALGGEQTNETACERALAEVGLGGFEETLAGRLSAGQKRRVALARLVLAPRALWVLDEPFTSLDREVVQVLERLIVQHACEGGSVVVTTHHALGEHERLRRLRLGGGIHHAH